jgi:tetratricopeptide (TPR) repeat protein
MRHFLTMLLTGCLTLRFLLPGPAALAAESRKERVETILLQGVEKALNLDKKGAVTKFGEAIELNPQNPIGFSCQAMTYLFFYETSFTGEEKKGNEDSLLQAVADAQARAGKRIEQDPRDGEAYFAAALAKMVMDRWEMARKNYYRAFREAQSVWEYLEKTRELNPDNYDVYYPMGVIHYYLAQLSGLVQWIASLFLTSGDRERGLKELELAAEKGVLLKDMARSSLVSIYYGYENEPARALPLARRLKEKYPDNYNFSFALADTLSSLGRFDEALSVSGEIEKGIRAGTPPYRSELWPRYHQLLGKIYLDRGDYERSAQYLSLALKDVAPYNARVRAWALVRLGMIQDARKERQRAEDYYRRALEVEGAEGRSQRAAREYLEMPYEPTVRK